MTVCVLIVDEYQIVREGLRALLQRDHSISIVGEATNGAEAIEQARQLKPEVVLLDIALPVVDGITVTTIIRHELPSTKVLILTGVQEQHAVLTAIQAGASGYLLKDIHGIDLRKAVKATANGQTQFSPAISIYLLHAIQIPEQLIKVTEREKDVLHLLSYGYTNKEIAHFLDVTEDTIKTHVHHLLAKLGVRRRSQAMLAAMQMGMISTIQQKSRP
ncbi:MAG TPA: response regulator transcription factor [Dictyobacter sp.]|jgi:DNA-binding NarL/FixJ family response regulator|nr:response regulator transcription factor [Dictyobacter sp.]